VDICGEEQITTPKVFAELVLKGAGQLADTTLARGSSITINSSFRNCICTIPKYRNFQVKFLNYPFVVDLNKITMLKKSIFCKSNRIKFNYKSICYK